MTSPQGLLRHANLAMTRDLYSHVTADMQRQAADALEPALADPGERIA